MAEETDKKKAEQAEQKILRVSSSPHLMDVGTTRGIMYEVVFGLVPAVVMGTTPTSPGSATPTEPAEEEEEEAAVPAQEAWEARAVEPLPASSS